MKRELKFRAWSGFEIIKHHEINPSWFWSGKFGLWEVMQYTGMKDKNGKDIYEGDVVQTVADDGTRLSKFKIYWSDESCCFMKEREDGERYCLDVYQTKLEVIGNIYEPELIPL